MKLEKDNSNINLTKIKTKKYKSIDVEENLENILKEQEIREEGKIDVKNKKFKKPCEIENNIIYDGKDFYLDSHQNSKYPTESNYRCKNYRKDQRIRKKLFCNTLLKRKEDGKIIYYNLEK